MQYYEYHKKSQHVQDSIKEKYPFLFSHEFSSESVEVRYYLFEYLLREYNYMGGLTKDLDGRPLPIDIGWGISLYWSVSHSSEYVAFVVSDRPTGIDIAEYEIRDESVLDTHPIGDYILLWGKDWSNFYLLWTAKEAIIKLRWWKLDDMKLIQLEHIMSPDLYEFNHWDMSYWVQSKIENTVYISYIVS